jgi:hypothetical protein
MHTSGLILTLVEAPGPAAAALAKLATAGPFTLGEATGPLHAVALETADARAAQDWHDWAESLPGVAGVEVVFVHWDESEAEVDHV